MKLLNKLERKIGRFAIKNLMVYIIALNAAVFLLMQSANTYQVVEKLILTRQAVMAGEVWRLVTYVFIPPTTSLIWIFFTLYFYYMVGKGLEQEWGSFKFNVYYLIGVLGTAASVFISGGVGTSVYLNLSLFLAFAYIYPNFQIMLFFILPVKMKYLGWISGAYLGFSLITGSFTVKLAIIAALANFLLFFGKDMLNFIKNKKKVYGNKARYQKKVHRGSSYHKCSVCGITDADDETMEFRYCSKCKGDKEYCMNHLFGHEHK